MFPVEALPASQAFEAASRIEALARVTTMRVRGEGGFGHPPRNELPDGEPTASATAVHHRAMAPHAPSAYATG